MGNANSVGTNKSDIPRRASSAIEAIKPGKSNANADISNSASGGTVVKGMSRTVSGTDINEKHYTQFVPVEKLSKVCKL